MSPADKLKKLWDKGIEMEGEMVQIQLDRRSHYEIMNTARDEFDGSYNPMHPERWREIPIWLSHIAAAELVNFDADYKDDGVIVDPQIIAIHVRKPNGRMIYLDAEGNEERCM